MSTSPDVDLALPFNPADWFWKVDGGVFSSKSGKTAATTDIAFSAFVAAGGTPSICPDAAGMCTPLAVTEMLETSYGIRVSPFDVPALAIRLAAAARTSADAITAQVATCETHLTGYTNAAMYVAAAGGAPSTDPVKSAFEKMAAANGLTADDFATLCDKLSAAAMSLSAVLAALQGFASKATTVADLASALSSFERSIGAQVAALNTAGLTVQIQAPPAISIAGINA